MSGLLRILVFAVLSAALAYLSRASLAVPRSHGFYRFLAWECIVALVLLNFLSLRQWFANPFSFRQLVSWFLLIVSLVPVLYGTYLLRTQGRPGTRQAGDPSLLRFERTGELVTTGVFHYIRHPLYSSLLLLAWGVFFKHPTWAAGALALSALALLLATAKVEEVEDVRYFGDAYRAYMRRTRMFIPFVF